MFQNFRIDSFVQKILASLGCNHTTCFIHLASIFLNFLTFYYHFLNRCVIINAKVLEWGLYCMKKTYAWLVVNGFICSDKFEQLFAWLVQAAERQNCILEVKRNTQLLPRLLIGTGMRLPEMPRPQFAIFWDKDVRLAHLLENYGLRLFNRAESIEICDDKARTFLELMGHGIRMPKTIIAPKTFHPEGFMDFGFLQEAEQALGYPFVLKECFGSFGQQVYLVHDRQEAEQRLRGIKNRPCLFQEFIASSKGHDVRIQMAGDCAVAAMYRYNEQDFRANVTNGGRMKPYEPDSLQIEWSRKVMRILKLDFAGIDWLFGEDGEPVLCEVNSNAHFINMHQCTGINAADFILSHCLQEMKRIK